VVNTNHRSGDENQQGYILQQDKTTPYNRDHVPVLCKYEYRLYFDDASKLPEQPDVDLMMNAWLVGKDFDKFATTVDVKLGETKEAYTAATHDPDVLCLLQQAQQECAAEVFPKQTPHQIKNTPEFKALRGEMQDLHEELRTHQAEAEDESEEESLQGSAKTWLRTLWPWTRRSASKKRADTEKRDEEFANLTRKLAIKTVGRRLAVCHGSCRME